MIPISKDVASLVGDWADGVENRSLLHEKFALPKVWGAPHKLNNAGRWSVLRIVNRGADLLRSDSQQLHRESARNSRPEIAKQKYDEALIAEKLSVIGRPDPKLTEIANCNTRLFLKDLERSYDNSVATFEATLGGRMMVNLAGGVVENAGISLDRCFGLPIIPGSAVKGITRVQALWDIRESPPDDKHRLLLMAMLLLGYGAHDIRGDFAWAGEPDVAQEVVQQIGAAEFKGCACFLPAYPTTPPTLVVDMVNPHYPGYYSGMKLRAEDNENPIPNYFPAVEAGSSFGFAVLLNRVPEIPGLSKSDLLAQARIWMERAVTRKGIGAKTAAGYGWFELGQKTNPQPTAQTAAPASGSPSRAAAVGPADTAIARWQKRLTTKDNFPAALPELMALTDDADLAKAFEAVIPEPERKKLKRSNPYWQSFTSGKHAEAGKKILQRLKIKLS